MTVEAELKRKNVTGNLVDWIVNDDGSEPVADAAARTKLDTIITALASLLAELNQKYEGGAVALDAGTLAALEQITVTVTNPTTNPETGLAKDATVQYLKNKFQPGVRTTAALTVNTIGDNTIYTPAAGKKVRLHWLGMSASQNNAGENKVTVKFASGGSAKYIWRMGNPGAFSHWEPIEGAVNEAFIVNLTTADAVDVNYTLEEV